MKKQTKGKQLTEKRVGTVRNNYTGSIKMTFYEMGGKRGGGEKEIIRRNKADTPTNLNARACFSAPPWYHWIPFS